MSLGLYIHLPWCIRKCPYCDFNSHAVNGPLEPLEQKRYIHCLIQDLQQQLEYQSQKLSVVKDFGSIFIGGGTPSLFSPHLIEQLIATCCKLFFSKKAVEVTMEVNPGTTETHSLAGYWQAGVNRLSIGVQSFNDNHLQQLGRIHRGKESMQAIEQAQSTGFERINIDLMYALASQNLLQAREDLQRAIATEVSHISYYQLTLEPNTLFAKKPPANMPTDDLVWEIQQQAEHEFSTAGFKKYEVSAWSSVEGHACQHNLNYWRFGDYVGIGAGAHGKFTDVKGSHYRTRHAQSPNRYMQDIERGALPLVKTIEKHELPVEFMINQLRLKEGFFLLHYREATGLMIDSILPHLKQAQQQGMIACSDETFSDSTYVKKTDRGENFLNNLQALFFT